MSATRKRVSAASSPATPVAGISSRQRHPASTLSAFWIMTRRVTLLAASVDTAFLIFFLVVGSPLLGWLNVISIGMYAAAYALLLHRRNFPALLLIWVEVVAHATIGTMLLGWDSGFHYYLVMFIPAIVISGDWRRVTAPLVILFLSYLGLHAASHAVGTLAPLGDTPLQILNVFNVSIFFAMASYTARFYYELVRKSERKLRDLATRDALTGLSNRRHLMDLALPEIARAQRAGQPVSLVLADIDDFKQINDGYGHDAGDLMLVRAAAVFRETCGAQDIVARWGGEEFLFLLPNADPEAAMAFAEGVRVRVAAMSVEHEAKTMGFTLSLGVSLLLPNENLDHAINRADDALYLSKSAGRNRVTQALPLRVEAPLLADALACRA